MFFNLFAPLLLTSLTRSWPLEIDMHALGHGIRLDAGLAQLPADAALLDAAKGHAVVGVVAAVDPDHAGLEGARDAHRRRDEEAGGLGRRGRQPRRRRHGGVAAQGEGRALGEGVGDARENVLLLLARDLRALEGRGRKGVAEHGDVADDGEEAREEGVVDIVVDEEARGGGADLAGVGHEAVVGPARGAVEVGVGEDEQRRLAARLERHGLEGGGGQAHDGAAGRRAAGEGELVDAGVGGEGGAGVGAAAVEHVEHAARQAGGGHEAGEVEHGQGRLLGGLEDDRVAGGEGRGQLPAGHGQRVVPGDDLSADAERLAQRVGKLGGAEIHGLAVPLVGPAGIVAEHGHEVWDVLGEARRQGLAVVERLNGGQRQGVGLDEVGEVVEELAPCRGRQVTPGRVLKGGTGGGDGRVDVGFCGCMDGADGLFGAVTVRHVLKALSDRNGPHKGLTVVICWPLLLLTNSLLIKRPCGCFHETPFGAVNSISRRQCASALKLREMNEGSVFCRCRMA
ncbi:hypothetical protein BN1708_009490 [Verticillium longisporum]|uniref:Uncharacterized protein n=1 Tax=Verticillium longisporum TaxID=100787 RepID=A0A0G4KJ04_VERLO|nr:hypothetical protein BN1708_009490 [Verticillium longisporum]